MKAKKSLGQNFLIDKNIIKKITDEIPNNENDLVVEIGPGRGALTSVLKEKGVNVIAYELDSDMHLYLDKLENQKLKINYQDILRSNISNDIAKVNYDKLYIVGNLPYYITTPIIEHIISMDLKFEKFIIMVQKEVADRFMAVPKSKDYGYMTLILKYYFDAYRVCNVSQNCFKPAPKVESAVIGFTPRLNKPSVDILKYRKFLQDCFKQKRKTLKNNLDHYDWGTVLSVLKDHNISSQVRAEELNEEIFIELYKKIFNETDVNVK